MYTSVSKTHPSPPPSFPRHTHPLLLLLPRDGRCHLAYPSPPPPTPPHPPLTPSLPPSLPLPLDTLIPFSSLGMEDAIWPILHLPLKPLLRLFGTIRPPTSLPVLLPFFNTMEKQYYLFGAPLSTKRFKGGYENTEACQQTFDALFARVYLLIEEGRRLRGEDGGRYVWGRVFALLGWRWWVRRGGGWEGGRGVTAGIGTLLRAAGEREGGRVGGGGEEEGGGRSGGRQNNSSSSSRGERKKEGREGEEHEQQEQEQEQASLRQRRGWGSGDGDDCRVGCEGGKEE